MVARAPHSVSIVTTHLMNEIRIHGPRFVAQNRFGLAARFEEKGDHEWAERLEREGEVALELVPKLVA